MCNLFRISVWHGINLMITVIKSNLFVIGKKPSVSKLLRKLTISAAVVNKSVLIAALFGVFFDVKIKQLFCMAVRNPNIFNIK